jgi:hypothetical protein
VGYDTFTSFGMPGVYGAKLGDQITTSVHIWEVGAMHSCLLFCLSCALRLRA